MMVRLSISSLSSSYTHESEEESEEDDIRSDKILVLSDRRCSEVKEPMRTSFAIEKFPLTVVAIDDR